MSDDYKTYAELFRAKAAAEDLADYNHAVSGADVGRILKHGANTSIDPATGKKRNEARDAVQRTLDWLLKNDPVYAQTWQQTSELLKDVANEADLLMAKLLSHRAALQEEIDSAADRAATLPDGRKVFRDSNGNVVDKEGRKIDEDLAAGIIWQGNELTYEEYRALKDRLIRFDDAIREVQGIETDLGGMNNDLHDQQTPPAHDDLDSFKERADSLRDRLKRIDADLTRDTPNAPVLSDHIETPDVSDTDFARIPTIKLG